MKKVKCQSKMEKGMTEYEKQRLHKLKLNASRMKAVGLGSLANKILISKYDSTAKTVMSEGDVCLDDMASDDMVNEDGEYEPSDMEDSEEGEQMDLEQNHAPITKGLKQQKISMVELAMARKNRKKSPPNQQETIPSEKEGVQEEETGLMKQKISMVELAMARKNRKKSPPNQQQTIPSEKEGVQEEEMVTRRTSPREAHQPVVQKTQQKKVTRRTSPREAHQDPQQVPQQKRVQPHGKSDKHNGLNRSQFCSPGSFALYRQMKQRKQQSNVGELLSLDLPPTLEGDEAIDILSDSTQQPSDEFPPDLSMDNQNELGFECHEENQDNTSKAAEKKKNRGQTMMKKVHQRPFNECRVIVLNGYGQPIGPSDALVEFRNFLGTLAKTHQYAPLNILDWKYMPTKENIWSFVKEKYIIPEEGKDYVLKSANDLWHVYKSRMKKKHFKRFPTDELRKLLLPIQLTAKSMKMCTP